MSVVIGGFFKPNFMVSQLETLELDDLLFLFVQIIYSGFIIDLKL